MQQQKGLVDSNMRTYVPSATTQSEYGIASDGESLGRLIRKATTTSGSDDTGAAHQHTLDRNAAQQYTVDRNAAQQQTLGRNAA